MQKAVRAYLARKKVEKIREKEMIFLGMVKKKPDSKDPSSRFFKANKIREYFRDLQK